MTKRNNPWLLALLFGLLIPVLAACSDDENDNPLGTTTDAFVRVAHLSPDAPPVDVFVDGSEVLSDVDFKTFSPYLKLGAGDHEVSVRLGAAPNTEVLNETLTLVANAYYTAAATGLADPSKQNALALSVFVDDVGTQADKARVRFIHASPDAPGVDITLTNGDVIFGGVEFPEASDGYATLEPGRYTLQVRAAGTDTIVLAYKDLQFGAGSVLTIFAAGLLSDESLGAIATVDDADEGNMSLEPEAAPITTNIRVAHLSPDAPNVDVWVDGSKELEDVPFEGLSPYLALDAGEHTIWVVETGSTDPKFVNATIDFFGTTDYTVAATGSVDGGSFGPQVWTDDNYMEAGKARVRFTHASPDAPPVDITLRDGTVLFGNVEFNENAGYISVDPGSYTLQVRLPGSETVVGAFTGVAVEMGVTYTISATGFLSDSTLGALASIDSEGNGSSTIKLEIASSRLRAAHLSPDAGDVDIWVDGSIALRGVPFQAVSDYLPLDPGMHTVVVVPAGETSPEVINETVTLTSGEAYTLAATGLLDDNDIQPLLLSDEVTPAKNGDAWVRFVHTSPDAPLVDVAITGGPILFSNVEFREDGGYLAVDPGIYDLEVRVAGTPTVALPLPGQSFDGSSNYTVFAIGLLMDESLSALPVVDTPLVAEVR